jgi:hypothetical protein
MPQASVGDVLALVQSIDALKREPLAHEPEKKRAQR